MFEGKNVLITGGSGMIGRYLVDLLLKEKAKISVVSLDDEKMAPAGVKYTRGNLTDKRICMSACKDMEYVFHLAGVKGSPKMTMEKPASFMTPMMQFNVNMMEAAWNSGVKRYLYTSSIGVYHPARILREEDVWETFPSPMDRFAGWTKRMGELQAEAYRIEHNWNDIVIVRPANVYGRFDNFDLEHGAMVIPSLISRTVDATDNRLTVWGDGSASRDFIHASDVAKGIVHMMKANPRDPINLGSGTGTSIREIVSVILKCADVDLDVCWDESKPVGDVFRILDTNRATNLGWKPETSLEDGIKDTIRWFKNNKEIIAKRYSIFKET